MNNASSPSLQEKVAVLEQQLAELGQNYSTALAECEGLRQAQAENSLPEGNRQATALADLLEDFSSQLFSLPGIDGCAIYLLDSAGDFVRRADTALYSAKQNGRNRIEILPCPE